MFKLQNGKLSITNEGYEKIYIHLNNGTEVMDALDKELKLNNIDIKDVHTVEIKGSQIKDKKYLDIYSDLVIAFWHKKIELNAIVN